MEVTASDGDTVQCVVVRHEGGEILRRLTRDPLTIGSGRDNDLRVLARGVSRQHAVLIPQSGVWVLSDVGSLNGVICDGRRVQDVELRPGVEVTLGHATLTLEDHSLADVEIVLSLSEYGGELPDRTTDVVEGQSLESQVAGAMRLVRSWHERVVDERVRADEARCFLGARSLLSLVRSEGETVIELQQGGVIPEIVTRHVELEMAKARERSRRGFRVATAHCPAFSYLISQDRVLILVFDHQKYTVPSWEWELLEVILSHHQRGYAAEKSAKNSLPRARLKFPAGMVVGSSEPTRATLEEIERTALNSWSNVLLTGETGTGKELYAQLIHASGPTAGGPFTAVNCSAIPGELLEAELFGIDGRIATGVDPRPGLFSEAEGGTLMLDEISEMALPLQAKLLRVLETREVRRVGSSKSRRVNVRVIAASNAELSELIKTNQLRADLYYRLRQLEFRIAPLRVRREEIGELTLAFARDAARQNGRQIVGLSRSAMDRLLNHDWPGNVRELKADIERAVSMAGEGGVVTADHFPLLAESTTLNDSYPASEPWKEDEKRSGRDEQPLKGAVEALERQLVTTALFNARGNKSETARRLGLTRNGLASKMRKLGLLDE